MVNQANKPNYHYANVMIEHMPIGIAIYDAQEFRLLEANALFLASLNTFLDLHWHNEQIIGRSITEFGSWLFPLGISDIFYSVAETGQPYRAEEMAAYTIQGQLTFWNWTLDCIRDSAGSVSHVVQTLIEVTTQVQARQSYLATEADSPAEAERKRLEVIEIVERSVRELMDTQRIGAIAIDAIQTYFHPDFISLHTADNDQRMYHLLCVHVPPDSKQIVSSLQQVPFTSSLLLAQTAQHRQPLFLADLQAAVKVGRIDQQHPLIKKKMRGFICTPLWFGDQLEGVLTAAFSQVIQPTGPEMRTFLSIGTHIAAALAQARLHVDIQNRQMRLHSVLDQLPEGIIIAEIVSGSIDYANPAAGRLLRLPLPQLIGTPVHRFAQSYASSSQAGIEFPTISWNFFLIQALSGETVRSKETTIIHSDGSQVSMLVSAAPLYTSYDGNQVMTGAVMVFQDITAQKSIEQHKNEFLSIANHELRTPITIIQGFAELLKLEETNTALNDFTRSALAHIIDQSEHLARLIKAMLDVSRIEHEQFELKLATHDLLPIITHIVKSQAIMLKYHHIHLRLEGLQETATLIGTFDKERVVQVINNLINNAIKYSPEGGEIEVGLQAIAEVRHPDRYREVLIWVKDQGIGIAPDEIPHIFERFHRARTLDRSFSGFGIGLYIVKEIITRHSGRVWVESTVGVGSTFYIRFPLKIY
ncbi:ATP-binding protein [Ktedonosporobacter rubrisoli]|uniref:ATP-binding protein n=1 Tax=Ktedonosporobacter rubrisoli TaxID=2509675 RepID=UPI0013EE853B|nr:ATP-binding protein [Ktedonosporobacter rubrisoli]